MKKTVVLFFIVLAIYSCKTTQTTTSKKDGKKDNNIVAVDSLLKINNALNDSIQRLKELIQEPSIIPEQIHTEIVKEDNTVKEIVKGVVFVSVKGGSFMMGSNENGYTQHKENVSDFQISETEITNALFAVFLNETGVTSDGKHKNGKRIFNAQDRFVEVVYKDGVWRVKSGFENHPITCVTWFGADEYCKWAGGRLPTEIEWEYAARGGQKSKGFIFSGSDNSNEVAWFSENSNLDTKKVGTKKANELGIYDMSGNVAEWCADWYSYIDSNGTRNANMTDKVVRGGSWGTSSNSFRSRVYVRDFNLPENCNFSTGFRIAK